MSIVWLLMQCRMVVPQCIGVLGLLANTNTDCCGHVCARVRVRACVCEIKLKGVGLHNVLWASMVSLSAHSTAVWYWDLWVDCAHDCLYHHFTGTSNTTTAIS